MSLSASDLQLIETLTINSFHFPFIYRTAIASKNRTSPPSRWLFVSILHRETRQGAKYHSSRQECGKRSTRIPALNEGKGAEGYRQ